MVRKLVGLIPWVPTFSWTARSREYGRREPTAKLTFLTANAGLLCRLLVGIENLKRSKEINVISFSFKLGLIHGIR